jgi:GntR family transcriptional regulator
MSIFIDENDTRPIYRQVADEIRSLIARGELAEGVSLPPVRQLAANLGVNLNTIATAYRDLQNEGLITVRHGVGATVAARTPTADRSDEELSKPLRNALTQLALAGRSQTEIMRLVTRELSELFSRAEV